MSELKEISLDLRKVRALASFFVETMNDAQAQEMTIDEVIGAALYAAGASMAQRGVSMTGRELIGEYLTPLMMGFQDAKTEHLDLVSRGPQ